MFSRDQIFTGLRIMLTHRLGLPPSENISYFAFTEAKEFSDLDNFFNAQMFVLAENLSPLLK